MQKPHILIIDDDRELVKKYKEVLEKANYKVSCTYNGKEGLDKLKLFNIDLVILDLQMPVMNGVKVLEAIRDNEALRKTKVLVSSSYAYKKEASHGMYPATRTGRKAYHKGEAKGGHRGRMHMTAKQMPAPGLHSEFRTWLLSCVDDALKRQPEPFEREKKEDEPDRILIVDDDKKVVDKIASWLKQEGFNDLLFAYNGTKALEKLSTEPIDLVILDLNMPDTNGEEVIKVTRTIPVVKDIPIVIFSSVGDTTSSKDLFGSLPSLEVIDENNIRSRIHRYRHVLGETYNKPPESKMLNLLHLDKPKFLLARVKKELQERRRLASGYLARPVTILRNKKGQWLEGHLEGYAKAADSDSKTEVECSYCGIKKTYVYQYLDSYPISHLCKECTSQLKKKHPEFAKK